MKAPAETASRRVFGVHIASGIAYLAVVECPDRAVMDDPAEIEKELLARRTFRTRDEARQAIFEFIEVFYNRKRRHSSIGYLSPEEFERSVRRPPMLREVRISPVSGTNRPVKIALRRSDGLVIEPARQITSVADRISPAGAERGAKVRMESPHGPVSTSVGQVHLQPDHPSAMAHLPEVTAMLASRFPEAASLLESAAEDVLAHMHFPREHRRRLHSTNPLERLHKEIKRRTNVVGIFPNRDSLMRMVVTLLQEQDDEWQVADRRYFSLGSMARIDELQGGESTNELLAANA